MDWMKTVGYIIYAIGIVGCVEGVIKESVPISIGGIMVVVIGSVILGACDPGKSSD